MPACLLAFHLTHPLPTPAAPLATCSLCYVVHMTAIDKNSPPSTNGLAPIAIGFAVFLGHSVLIPLDGCSINPARSFGPALVAGKWHGYW